MGFSTIPIEVLELILVLPLNWNNHDDGRQWISKRRVCKTFDVIISRQVFSNLNFQSIKAREAFTLNEAMARWLLRLKWIHDSRFLSDEKHTSVYRSLLWNPVVCPVEDNPDNSNAVLHNSVLSACAYTVSHCGVWGVCNSLEKRPFVLGNAFKLSLAAHEGNENLIASMISDGVDVNTYVEWLGYPLCGAVVNGHLSIVERLLAHGAQPNVRNIGATPLILAVKQGNIAVLRLLLNVSTLDPNIQCHLSALQIACELGNIEAVRLLLADSRTDANLGGSGDPPLLIAARDGHESIVRLFLEQDVEASLAGQWCRCPFNSAAVGGHNGIVRLLLDKLRANTPLYQRKCEKLLFLGASKGNASIVELLLGRRGIHPNRCKTLSQSPLSEAACNGYHEVVRVLLQWPKMDPNAKQGTATPLYLAAYQGHDKVVELLLQCASLNPNIAPSPKEHPLIGAAQEGHVRILEMLLARSDIDVNRVGPENRTALSFACEKGYEDAVRALLARDDINLHQSNDHGVIPFISAGMSGHASIVRLLLERDPAIIDTRSLSGYSCLILAARGGHLGVVQTLLEFGADSYLEGQRGRTALIWARKGKYHEIEQAILEHQESLRSQNT